MTTSQPKIVVNVDLTNPGQYFACCGLLELSDRLWPGAEGWFETGQFKISASGNLIELMRAIVSAELIQLDPEDNTGSPIEIRKPFRPLRLDWWQDELAGGKELKVWAGTMESVRIAKAMQGALRNDDLSTPSLFNVGLIAYDPDNPLKKVEPYYFDARRGSNAHSRDVGFSPNDLQMTTTAFPAVELLCLIGLQRCLPAKTNRPRVYNYFVWPTPIPPVLLSPVVTGETRFSGTQAYQFENWYRTGQRKHKAFRSAVPISLGDYA